MNITRHRRHRSTFQVDGTAPRNPSAGRGPHRKYGDKLDQRALPDRYRHETTVEDGIETAIRERLMNDAQLKGAGIKIRSDNSVVTLRGKISDPKAKSHASDVVRGVPGVRAVRNELAL